MFDANAAHIKEGEKFFAEVHAVDAQLTTMGVKCGDIVLCEHVTKSEGSLRDNLISKIYTGKDSAPLNWHYDIHSEDWSWMVYSGDPNGNGFINDKYKQKALDFLGGEWGATND